MWLIIIQGPIIQGVCRVFEGGGQKRQKGDICLSSD